MEMLFTTYNLLLKIILLFIVFSMGYMYSGKFKLSKLHYVILFFVHYFISTFSWILSVKLQDDAVRYYDIALASDSWFELFGLSVKFISFVIYPFVKYLKFDFQLLFLIFSTFSFFGFLILSKVLKSFEWSEKLKVLNVNVATIILFLPGFHLWVTPIGKDSLVFITQVLILNELIKPVRNKKRIFFLALALGVVRPYLMTFIFGAFLLYILLRKINSVKRINVFFLVIAVTLLIMLFIHFYLDINVLEQVDRYYDFLSRYAKRKLNLGSYIVPNEHNIFEKTIYYLLSPLFFDAKNAFQFLLSIENLVLLILLIKLVGLFSFKQFRTHKQIRFIVIYILVFLYVKALFLYNIGLASRQKIMIFPLIYYLMFYLNEVKYKKFSK